MNQYLIIDIHEYLYTYRNGRLAEEYRREIRWIDDSYELYFAIRDIAFSFHDRILVKYNEEDPPKPHLQYYDYYLYQREVYYGVGARVAKLPRNYLYTYEDPDWLGEVISGSKN